MWRKLMVKLSVIGILPLVFYSINFMSIIKPLQDAMESKPHLMYWGDLRQYYLTAEYIFAREHAMTKRPFSYHEIVPQQASFASAMLKYEESRRMFEILSYRLTHTDDSLNLKYVGVESDVETLLLEDACQGITD
jgi:hypothetical protein